MTSPGDAEWFAERTAGAPQVLRARASDYLSQAAPAPLATRLSYAGRAALAASTRDGAGRGAALDLLAADALITLALLAAAEQEPGTLASAAVTLRAAAASP